MMSQQPGQCLKGAPLSSGAPLLFRLPFSDESAYCFDYAAASEVWLC